MKKLIINLLIIISIIIFRCSLASTNNMSSNLVTIDTRSLFERFISAQTLISPGSSISTPTAYGLGWPSLIFGITGQNGTTLTSHPFGEYAAGFGIGNASKFVSLTTVATFGGLDEFTRDGNLNFQLSRNLFISGASIAIGMQNVAPWGSDKNQKISSYFVASQLLPFQFKNDYLLSLLVSIGVGNTRFVNDLNVNETSTHQFRPFGSIGFQVLPQIDFIVEYVGLIWSTGVSIIPFVQLPLVANLTASDLTHRSGTHVSIAASLAYQLLL